MQVSGSRMDVNKGWIPCARGGLIPVGVCGGATVRIRVVKIISSRILCHNSGSSLFIPVLFIPFLFCWRVHPVFVEVFCVFFF